VLAWEGCYESGPANTRVETLDVLTQVGQGVPAGIELGYHLCYGSPADEHLVQPKDAGVMVEMTNAVSAGSNDRSSISICRCEERTDDAYFAPLAGLALHLKRSFISASSTNDDAAGDAARLAAARRHARVDGIATNAVWPAATPRSFPRCSRAREGGRAGS